MSKELYNVTLFPKLNGVWVYNPVKANIANDNKYTNKSPSTKDNGKVGFIDNNLIFIIKKTNSAKSIEIKLIEVIER